MSELCPLNEPLDELWIIIPDETYDMGYVDEEAASKAFRITLETEFGASFRPANIGVGADWPAFAVDLVDLVADDWWKVAGAYLIHEVVLKGEEIEKSLVAWRRMIDVALKFRERSPFIGTNGAKVLALEAICEKLARVPDSIELLGYETVDSRFNNAPEKLPPLETIAPSAPTEHIGHITHVMDYKVDGLIRLRAVVRGLECTILGG